MENDDACGYPGCGQPDATEDLRHRIQYDVKHHAFTPQLNPDKWLEHDARHIAQGDFGHPRFLAEFANRVLFLIGAPVEQEPTFLRTDIALQDAVECRNDGRIFDSSDGSGYQAQTHSL